MQKEDILPMKRNWLLFVALAFGSALAVSPLIAQDQKEEKQGKADGAKTDGAKTDAAKAEGGEKAKAEKAKGDVGLLDTDKNYLILVTKEGKLITLDFDQKTKVTELAEKDVKMGDV